MTETWFAPIRAYCERGDASFWAEPLNAVSNGAFLLAAVALLRRERRAAAADPAALALAGLIAVVGLGSFLFHTVAVRWSLFADVVPIALFIYAYFLLAMRRFLGLGSAAAILVTLSFAGFNIGLEPALDAIAGPSLGLRTNGSLSYLPAVLALVGVAAALRLTKGQEASARRSSWALIGLAALFALSLTLRTVDTALCPSLPMGTHFLWHLLNAGVLYGLVATASRHRAR
ncbi:ceramidase domain-containing protein [Methylobacterium sp. Leaf108]|uniref:ceramidase domain-containing protein n=1 Tax=Methylobacterium sp. Leaf108 TaxID=1736256 RepID=UPI000701DA32|nr:ceramidase domain-containing protein [Methylobacterium sp. Leaf108]KQP55036.1 hypothetical protein ASF39_04695 [Methylobacterium sp. Leaf108]